MVVALWVAVFGVFYGLAGIELQNSDYSSLKEFITYADLMFSNVIGTNLSNSNQQWTATVAMTYPSISNVLGVYSLFLWLLNILFMLMVLFHFICAFIKTLYELLMFDP